MKLLLSLFLFIFSQTSWALLTFEDATSPELITSARALGMGNAYMSKVDDAWASFYNPAGLGTVRKLQSHVNLHLEINSGFLDATGGSGSFFESTGNYASAFTAAGVRTLLAAKPGNTTHARVQIYPSITFRGISVGYMYSQQQKARIKSADNSDFELAERVDSGPVLGISASLFGGVIKFGVGASYLTRKELQKDFLSTDPTSIDADVDYKKGSMVHLTAGARVTLPIFLLPTLSVVVRNSSASDFDSEGLGGLPDSIPQTVDAGFSITPFVGRTTRFHIEVNMKDIGNRYEDVPSQRKLVGGFEIGFLRRMFIRGGFGDGWGSGGIGVRNDKFIFDLTTYAIEASDEGYREDEDRRSVLNVSMGF